MKKAIIIHIFSIIIAVLSWNFIIGTAICRNSYIEQETDIGKHCAPYSLITSGTEGYSQYTTDKNGFNNDKHTADMANKILVLGDSHTEAMQVFRKDNFCSIAQELIQLHNDVYLYNVGYSGNSLAEYIYFGNGYLNRFKPIETVIQVTYDDFTSDALNKSKSIHIDNKDNNFVVLNYANKTTEVKNSKIIAISPFITLGYKKIKTAIDSLNSSSRPFFPKEASEVNKETKTDYSNLIDWEVKQISNIYKGKIVFLFLPHTPYLESNEIIKCDVQEEVTKSLVETACKKYNIDFIDLKPEFENLANKENKFPRGFYNTKISTGHLNKDGHYVTGKKLAQYLNRSLNK